MSHGPGAPVPESPPSGPAAASEPVLPSSPELDDEPESDDEPELPLVDTLPLEELEPLPDEDALEDPPSDSSCGEGPLPLVEHPKDAHAKARAAARRSLAFIECLLLVGRRASLSSS